MTTLDTRCLEAFPAWLRSLGEDAKSLAALLESPSLSDQSRRRTAEALTYLFKSLDLIPDGLEDLGFIDDAFVFRVAMSGLGPEETAADESGTLARLVADTALIEEFMGDAYPRLSRYVEALSKVSARGRSVDEVLESETKRAELAREVRQWAESYETPTFARDEKSLVKLRSFLSTKLPQ